VVEEGVEEETGGSGAGDQHAAHPWSCIIVVVVVVDGCRRGAHGRKLKIAMLREKEGLIFIL
jgi:hypothetical protein